jgi:hypothetical protein
MSAWGIGYWLTNACGLFRRTMCVAPDRDMGLLNSLVKAWMLSRSGHDCSRRDFNPTSEQLSEGFSELKKVSLVRDGMGHRDMTWAGSF